MSKALRKQVLAEATLMPIFTQLLIGEVSWEAEETSGCFCRKSAGHADFHLSTKFFKPVIKKYSDDLSQDSQNNMLSPVRCHL